MTMVVVPWFNYHDTITMVRPEFTQQETNGLHVHVVLCVLSFSDVFWWMSRVRTAISRRQQMQKLLSRRRRRRDGRLTDEKLARVSGLTGLVDCPRLALKIRTFRCICVIISILQGCRQSRTSKLTDESDLRSLLPCSRQSWTKQVR